MRGVPALPDTRGTARHAGGVTGPRSPVSGHAATRRHTAHTA